MDVKSRLINVGIALVIMVVFSLCGDLSYFEKIVVFGIFAMIFNLPTIRE